MIADHVSHLDQYAVLGRNFETAARFVRETDLNALAPGHYEIDGQRVFANVLDRELEQAPPAWEVHAKYADIHLILEGAEEIGCFPLHRLPQPPVMDEEGDCALISGLEGVLVPLQAGEFLICLPQDVHLPNVPHGKTSRSKKLILKVLMEEGAAR